MKVQTHSMPGTLLCGKAALEQLGHELSLRGLRSIDVLAPEKLYRKARRFLARIDLGPETRLRFLSPSHEPGASLGDALLLFGGPEPPDPSDQRTLIWVPISSKELENSIEAELTVIDHGLFKEKVARQGFYRRLYADTVGEDSNYPLPLLEPVHFHFSATCTLYRGGKALEALPSELAQSGYKRPLLLSDPGVAGAGLTEKLRLMLGDDLDLEIRTDVPPDSDTALVDTLAAACRESGRDCLLALGGGSVLDTAKGVAMVLSGKSEVLTALEGSGELTPLSFPWYAIPTTTGTGSECTKAAVISDTEQGRKLLFISPFLQARSAYLDAGLTSSLPGHILAQTGMDAMCHAVEAFTCLGKNPLSDLFAWKAIELLSVHLKQAILHPDEPVHREATALASSLAGVAFSNSMVGMVHTIGHALGAVCHAPHGACMAVLLPHALEFNLEAITPVLGQLLIPLKDRKSYEKHLESLRAPGVISILRGINHALKDATHGRHPERLRELHDKSGASLIQREDFPKVAATALGDASLVYNPREIGYQDIIDVLEKAY